MDRATARKTAQAQTKMAGTKTAQTKTATGTGGTKKGTTGTKKKTGTQQTTAPAQQSSALAATAVSGGVVIQASGALAQGLEAEQTSAGSLPTAACTSPGTNFWFTGPGQRTAGPDPAVPDERGQPGGRRGRGHLHRCRAAPGDHRHRDQRAATRHDRAVAGLHAAQLPGHRAARADQRGPGRGGRPGEHRGRPGHLAARRADARQAPDHSRAARGGPHPGAVHLGARGEGRHRPGDRRDLTGQLPADRGHRNRPARWVGGRDHGAVAGRDPGRAPADRQHLDHRGGADPRRRGERWARSPRPRPPSRSRVWSRTT